MEEILFMHFNERCHARIVESRKGNEIYIGEIDGYEIWAEDALFDQFGFIAVKKGERNGKNI